jgi:hypothetical protein
MVCGFNRELPLATTTVIRQFDFIGIALGISPVLGQKRLKENQFLVKNAKTWGVILLQ